MKIRLGTLADLNKVEQLYDIVTVDLEANINYPGWKKGIYPTSKEAKSGIDNKELYVVEQDKQIIGSITVNHEQDINYKKVNWNCKVADNEIYVIHTLAIHPQYKGLKIAQQLLEYTEKLAQQNNIKTIRLDVREGNIPAIKLYKRLGYSYLGSKSFDERGDDLGLFELYEKIL